MMERTESADGIRIVNHSGQQIAEILKTLNFRMVKGSPPTELTGRLRKVTDQG